MNKLSIIILVAFTFLFTNCQKEKFCSEGYTGPNCNEEITPLRISIDAIRVVRFPNRQPNGQHWDSLTRYPDLYINLYEERSERSVLNIDYEIEDVIGSVTFNKPVTFDYPGENYILRLMDADPIGSQQVSAMLFKPHKVGADFPSIINYQTNDLEIEFIGVKYNF